MDLRALSAAQLLELVMLEKELITMLEEQFLVDGVSVIQNNGAIMDDGTHFHVHLVPRYIEDGFWEQQVVEERGLSVETLRIALTHLKKRRPLV